MNRLSGLGLFNRIKSSAGLTSTKEVSKLVEVESNLDIEKADGISNEHTSVDEGQVHEKEDEFQEEEEISLSPPQLDVDTIDKCSFSSANVVQEVEIDDVAPIAPAVSAPVRKERVAIRHTAKKFHRSVQSTVTNSAIKRLQYKAGIPRLQGRAKHTIRAVYVALTKAIIAKAVIYKQHRKKIILEESDIVLASAHVGMKIYTE